MPVNNAIPGAVRQLRQSLRAGGLAGAVAAYFRPEEDFAGLSFTCLGRNPRDAVTASAALHDLIRRRAQSTRRQKPDYAELRALSARISIHELG